MKMNTYLRCIFAYFENVLHPAAGWSTESEKRKRKSDKADHFLPSPECFNVRGISKKNDKVRRNPAP
jgi:hypothetical protein